MGHSCHRIELNSEAVDWGAQDLSYLGKAKYDRQFDAMLSAARETSLDDALRAGESGRGNTRVSYGAFAEFQKLCRRLGIMEDLKAGVPRTGYRGVVILPVGGHKVRDHPRCYCPSLPPTRWRRWTALHCLTWRTAMPQLFLAPSYTIDQDITKRL